jgi:hypothetical protein
MKNIKRSNLKSLSSDRKQRPTGKKGINMGKQMENKKLEDFKERRIFQPQEQFRMIQNGAIN